MTNVRSGSPCWLDKGCNAAIADIWSRDAKVGCTPAR